MKNDSPLTTKSGRYFLTDRIREVVNFWTTARSEGLRPPPVQKSVLPDSRIIPLTFHSEESGFCVLRVKVKGHLELVTVIGSAASITPGEYVECIGVWTNDRTHGMQFKSNQLKVVPPTKLEGIEKYLGSGMVSQVIPVTNGHGFDLPIFLGR